MIDPRVASGTRDILPPLAMERERIAERLRDTFQRYGFVPIDTPLLERREVLYAKGGEEVQRQVYEVAVRGQRIEDSDLALRFDLTVPLARFMARHVDSIGLPFKRYHIGLVHRGERAQRGRYREFYQCDFDTIGPQSDLADAEIAMVIHDGLRAMGIERFRVLLNNRKLLCGALETLGVADRGEHVLRCLDKLGKIGPEAVVQELQFGPGAGRRPEGTAPADDDRPGPGDAGAAAVAGRAGQPLLSPDQARSVLDFVLTAQADSFDQTLDLLQRRLSGNELARQGLDNLRAVVELLMAAGVDPAVVKLDVALARGLDYYTGVVYEATVDGYEQYGSVCSGGRYDDLAGLFTARRMPGVGASFGLDRLAQVMADAGWLQQRCTAAPVLIVNFQDCDQAQYVRMSAELRSAGIGCELYPEPAAIRDQFGYAASRGHRLVVIAGPDELAAGTFALRDMTARRQQSGLPRAELASRVAQALGGE